MKCKTCKGSLDRIYTIGDFDSNKGDRIEMFYCLECGTVFASCFPNGIREEDND